MPSHAPVSKGLPSSHPLRVLGVFAAGIILPSCFLGYLGFHSLQVENILQREQTEERYAAVADLLQRKAGEMVNALAEDLRKSVVVPVLRQGSLAARTHALLSVTAIGGSAVQSILLIDGDGRLLFPFPEAGLARPSIRADADLAWGPYTRDMRRLERAEFVEKNVAAAVAGYEALLPRVHEPLLQAALLKAIAGGDRKLKRFQAAEARYLELVNHYDPVADPIGYPEGLLGRQLLAEVYEESGQPERGLDARLDLAQGLLLGHWAIAPSQRDWLLSDLKPVIVKELAGEGVGIGEARAKWSRLEVIEHHLVQARALAQDFLRARWPDLRKRLLARHWQDQGGVFQEAGTKELILLAPVPSVSGRDAAVLAIAVVEGGPFLQALQQAASELAQSS